jgi:hypothetical protein
MLKPQLNGLPLATDLCDATVTNISKVSGAFVTSESCANGMIRAQDGVTAGAGHYLRYIAPTG